MGTTSNYIGLSYGACYPTTQNYQCPMNSPDGFKQKPQKETINGNIVCTLSCSAQTDCTPETVCVPKSKLGSHGQQAQNDTSNTGFCLYLEKPHNFENPYVNSPAQCTETAG